MSDDEQAFEAVYTEFAPRIRRYLTRLAGAHEASDLTQEVFARVADALPRFRGEAALGTWIYRIATNAALDRLRRKSLPVVAAPPLPDEPVDPAPAPLAEAAGEEMRACIRDYVDQLPPDYRTVILLSEVEELADRDIAEVLGITLENVKIRLHRARARLREAFAQGCHFSRDDEGNFGCEPRTP